jgi:hypothetical protein
LEQVVFFNDWVPYAERGAYLLEADVGLSLHLDHLETRFAFRTRLLDCIWAGLPMVVTGGDTLADTVQTHGLGHVVQVRDTEATASALRDILDDPQSRASRAANFQAASTRFQWERALQPLIAFAQNPRRAADQGQVPQLPYTLGEKVRAAWKRGGPGQLVREIKQYVYWQITKTRGEPG